MRVLRIAMVAILVSCFQIGTTVADSSPAPEGSSVPVAHQSQQEVHPGETSTNMLVADWIALSGQFNDRLVTTVYWTLGALGTVLVAIVGLNWFANYRIYERDKLALTSMLNAEVSQQISALRAEISALHKKHSEEIEKAASNAAAKQIEPLTTQVKSDRSALKVFRDQIKTLELTVEMQAEAEQVRHWTAKNVPANVAYSHVRLAEVALKLGHNYYSYAIDDALEEIERLVMAGARGRFETDLVALLEKLPSQYGPQRQRILSKLSSI